MLTRTICVQNFHYGPNFHWNLFFYADDFRQHYVNENFLVCIRIFVGYDENYHGNLVRECCETCTSRPHGNRTEQSQNRNVNCLKFVIHDKDGTIKYVLEQ